MGRTLTPKYRIEYLKVSPASMALTPSVWETRQRYQIQGYGQPTNENLRRYIDKMNESFCFGGANQHVGMKVLEARVVRQSDNQEMARYVSPN